jgi:hypothetical protein
VVCKGNSLTGILEELRNPRIALIKSISNTQSLQHTLPSSPCHPESSIVIDNDFEGSLTEKQAHLGTRKEFIEGG